MNIKAGDIITIRAESGFRPNESEQNYTVGCVHHDTRRIFLAGGYYGENCFEHHTSWILPFHAVERVMESPSVTYDRATAHFSAGSWRMGFWEETPKPPKLVTKKTIMTTLNAMMKRLLDADTQKLVKAGLINGDLELTTEGRNALWAIVFEQNKAALVKTAEELIAEQEKSK